MSNQGKELYEFDSFRLDPGRRLLLRHNQPVLVQPKVFETLLLLVRHREQVVSKDDLMKTVWPDTFVEESNLAQHIFVLRKTLGETVGDHRYIVTIPGQGYSFAGKVRVVSEEETLVVQSHSQSRVVIEEKSAHRAWPSIVAIVIVSLIGGALYWRSHRAPKLTEKDGIVLADFANNTGDKVFDDTLTPALSVALRQSPFLNVLSDHKVGAILKLMARPAGTALMPEVARDLCQRAGSKAYLAGSIGSLGSEYVLGLKAVNCQNGDTLAEAQVTAVSREKVLDALGDAASKLRTELGESLATVQKFDVPLAQATTPSLEALQSLSLGQIAMGKADFAGSVPLFQRAIRLDPNFAMAYASLGVDYSILEFESTLGAENTRKAYELRERVSEQERFAIEAQYYRGVTGDLEKARQTYEVWAQTYPRDIAPRLGLSGVYYTFGQHDESLAESREALRLDPANALTYSVVSGNYRFLNRLEEARDTAQEALEKNLDSIVLRWDLYALAFLQNDTAEMARHVAWAAGKPGMEDWLLSGEAGTAAYAGRLGNAREFSRRAVASAERVGEKETAATYEVDLAVLEALFGNTAEAHEWAAAALRLSRGRDVLYESALALAIAGDSAKAQKLADDLAKRFPEDTLVQFRHLPTLHAMLALNRKDSPKAIEVLRAAAPYELGGFPSSLFPVYVRGEAYLAAHKGSEAVGEFQKILDHRGIVLNEPIGALAHLQLGRAYAMAGDAAKVKAAYEDFLTLWKDADPDIPILKQAKAEYAKLQ